jgi:branched-chain amino acid aminotransferase
MPRPGEEKIFAFYDSRLNAICRNPRLALIPLDDHMAHRGDGVFETLQFVSGRIYHLDEHLKLLENSAKPLDIRLPLPLSALREVVLAVARASGSDTGLLRVMLGRGPGGFGIDPAECPEPGLYIAAYAWSPKPDSWYETGLAAFKSSIPAKQPYLATIKNINYLPNVLMTREARQRGMDLAICFDDEGFLAEAAIANVALLDARGVFRVPEFTHSLAGTTVIRAAELLKNERPVEFCRLREKDILEATEFMALGTGTGCVGIRSYEGKAIGMGAPGPCARHIRTLLQQDLLETGTPF